MNKFLGYRRSDGTIGVRNHVIVINTHGELAGISKKIASLVPHVIPVTHQTGHAQYPEDIEQSVRTLKGTAANPNVSAALIIGMGIDDPAYGMAEELQAQGRMVHAITMNENRSISDVFKRSERVVNKSRSIQ
ncbi:UxaA family hydrolase [Sinobaca sp. H24]|uniref:UxaA family hydrolase n=1 Tax=Sinobaca sp. H24 TaxID=2923376 RepID=UPI0020794168|nr:UxaA family hydrolase [Sinobaca sp. H24]